MQYLRMQLQPPQRLRISERTGSFFMATLTPNFPTIPPIWKFEAMASRWISRMNTIVDACPGRWASWNGLSTNVSTARNCLPAVKAMVGLSGREELLVFTTGRNGPLTRATFNATWRKAVTAAKVAELVMAAS